jgi:hypothetical protein
VAGGERTVKVRFTSDTADLKRGVRDADSDLDRFTSGLNKLNQAAVAASTAVLVGFGAAIGVAANSLMRIERINAQTTQTIKSMNAEWANAAAIEAYAGELEALTSIEAESIQEGANLLLTFGNIRNELGAGNDIFNQAVAIMTDMSVVMGTDASASAIQLGKALNDPLKGITALTRVGVSFTEQQREQIEQFAEAGDIMSAQKVILNELAREFSGAGEALGQTTAGQVALLHHELGTLSEELTVALMPAISDAITLGRDFTNWALENQGTVKNLSIALIGTATAVLAINGAVKVYMGLAALVRGVTLAWAAAQWVLNLAMYGFPVFWIVGAIALIVAGVVLITKGMEGLGVTWGDVWDWIVDKTTGAVSWIWDKIDAWNQFVVSIPGRIRDAFFNLAAWISNPFINAFNSIARAWNSTVGSFSWTVPGWVPGIGGNVISAPQIRTFANIEYRRWGGRVRAGMPYVVGEGMGPELFVPSQNGTVVPNPGDGGEWGGDVYVAVEVGGEPIAAVARAERVKAGKKTRRWVRAKGATA